MLLSNIQDNIVKAPMVGASQAAATEKAKVEAQENHAENMEKARQAEEAVGTINQLEQEGIRREMRNPLVIDLDAQRRKKRKKGEGKDREEEDKKAHGEDRYTPISAQPKPEGDGHSHVDITI